MVGAIVHERKTRYTRLRVVDQGGWRYLVFDDESGDERLLKTEAVYQSRVRLNDPLRSWDTYTLAFQIPFLLTSISRSFFVGLGGGTIIRQYLHYYPHLQLDVAEIDPEVVEVARTYFDLPFHSRLKLQVVDGRIALSASDETYDLIALDAFWARTMPAHLLTTEFFQLVHQKLSESGLLALNINGTLKGAGASWLLRIGATLAQIFPYLTLFPTLGQWPERYQMILVVASHHRLPSPQQLIARARRQTVVGNWPNRFCSLLGDARPLKVSEAHPISDAEADQLRELFIY